MKKNILIFIGSLRNESHNAKLAKALSILGNDLFEMRIANIASLPFYNQDLENDFPQSVISLKNEILVSDALLFITPEYNRSFPGVLKNAIDWLSRSPGGNPFDKKPAAIGGASLGKIGTACAQQSLKTVLHFLGMRLMAKPELYVFYQAGLIDSGGGIVDVNFTKSLRNFLDEFSKWIATE